MQENQLIDLSMDFSVSVLTLTEKIKNHYALTNQLERAASSIGANIHEASYAQSKADFISKLHIALKECHETKYWLTLFDRASFADHESIQPLLEQCGTIQRKLIASINTAKSK